MAKNKRVKQVSILVCFVCVVIAIALFAFWASRPVKTTTLVTSSVQGANTSIDVKQLTTKYFTTDIPSTLILKNQNAIAHGNTLLQLFMTANTQSLNNPLTDQLAITIGNCPSDGLGGLTDVQLRLRHDGIYEPISLNASPVGAQAFVKTEGGYEMSVFWVHDNLYAAVVISGTSDRAVQLAAALDTSIRTWQWQ